jgi:hypothetical protein
MVKRLIAIAVGLMTAGCSVVGVRSGTEEPRHAVVDTVGAIEIRSYGERVAIETRVTADEEQARSEGFMRLAGYIFGDNRERGKIAMTAPVGESRDPSGGWRIRFYAPSSLTPEAMPAPDNPLVSVVAVPAETLAVLRFSGSRSPEAVKERQDELLRGLDSSPWRPRGQPFAWFYDPPWTIPAFRRNEVAVAVSRAPGLNSASRNLWFPVGPDGSGR